MKLLVIGSGGREHALCWKLAQSPRLQKMWCAPGNAGISQERLVSNSSLVACVPVGAEDLPALAAFARENQPDLTVVGPDNPLALGIVDCFNQQDLPIWGPNYRAAQFEASKAFSQRFMEKYGIPCPRSGIFESIGPALDFVQQLQGRCAVKADGLALGKGVYVCHELAEAKIALENILVARAFGTAGAHVVIQELLEGPEISLHALCDGTTAKLFPTAQDHKRVGDGDQGPNTGGMGAYSPTPFLSETELKRVSEAILDPWLRGCAAEGIDYRGLLYPGIMLTREGPKVLEFNARFGDPETQVYLPRLENDLVDLLEASRTGSLSEHTLTWKPGAAICVVMASAGYPGPYSKGKVIRGLKHAERAGAKVFHAGTQHSGNDLVTNGGRVLGITAWAGTFAAAQQQAYQIIDKIQFDGAQFRRDIGAKAMSHQSAPAH